MYRFYKYQMKGSTICVDYACRRIPTEKVNYARGLSRMKWVKAAWRMFQRVAVLFTTYMYTATAALVVGFFAYTKFARPNWDAWEKGMRVDTNSLNKKIIISRDDRARTAACRLPTATDRFNRLHSGGGGGPRKGAREGGARAKLGFPPSNVFNDNVVDPLNLVGLRRQSDSQHYVISRHWTSSGTF